MNGNFVLSFLTVLSMSKAGTASPFTKQDVMPDSCANKTFCFEKSSNYPQKLIDEMLENLDLQIIMDNHIELSDRDGDENPDNDCQRDSRFDPIYEILDENDNVRYVVQSTDKYQQKISTETCKNPGPLTSSDYYLPYQLKAFHLTCFEKKIEYWFTVLSLDGTQIETVKLKDGLPICCSCRMSNKIR